MRQRQRRYRDSGRKPGSGPVPGSGSAGFHWRRLPPADRAGRSGTLRRWQGDAVRWVFQKPLQEHVLVLKCLNAAREIVDLSFEQLDFLGKLVESGRNSLRTLE